MPPHSSFVSFIWFSEKITVYHNSMGFSENMMTSSNGNIFRVTGHLCGEFTGPRWIPAQRPVTRSFDVFFDLGPNKQLSKQWWGWWFETPPSPLWRHFNERKLLYITIAWHCILGRHLYLTWNLWLTRKPREVCRPTLRKREWSGSHSNMAIKTI